MFKMTYQISVITMMLLIGKVTSQLCGGEAYHPFNDLCCSGVIQVGKLAAGELCCSDISFDPSSFRNEAYSKEKNLSLFIPSFFRRDVYSPYGVDFCRLGKNKHFDRVVCLYQYIRLPLYKRLMNRRTHECKMGTVLKLSIQDTMICFANGTIVLMNDNADLYKSATAIQGALTPAALRCSVDMSENPKILISGCAASSKITLLMSGADSVDMDIVGGRNAKLRAVMIQCTGIPMAGINVTIDNFMTNYVTSPTVTYTAVPYIFLESKVFNPDTFQFTSHAMAGTDLLWNIKLPAEGYTALPLTCTAYSGTSRAGTPSKQITADGCSLNEDLIGDWVALSDNGINGLSASLWAFSFYNSHNVYLHCLLRLCPPGSSACAFSCEDRKRRRAVGTSGDTELREAAVTLSIFTNPVYVSVNSASKQGAVWFSIASSVAVGLLKYL